MQLTPHPSTPLPAGWRLTVEWRAAAAALQFTWLLRADTAAIRVPPRREPARRDGLWRHTCFELFVADPVGTGYREFNFSPSSEWAAYAFTDYRQGMAPVSLPEPPRIECHSAAAALQLQVTLPRAALAVQPDARGARRRCAFAAVLELADGSISYMALAHPASRPDFHHADGRVSLLDP